jgi:AraC-type DNA-binding domain-containing proteins
MKTNYFKVFETFLYIETYYDRHISTYLLSCQADMPERKYIQAFKKMFGSTPKQYLLSCRLHRVCDYLITTKYTVGKIMVLCGFDSKSYFYKSFKKMFGMTPAKFKYRQLHKNML